MKLRAKTKQISSSSSSPLTTSISILCSVLCSKFQPQTNISSSMEDTPSSSSPLPPVSTSQLQAEEADNSNEQNHQQPLGNSLSYRANIYMANPHLAAIRGDVCSCLIILITFWLVATIGLVAGIYGTTTLQLGPYSSVLIQLNSIFVQSIKVEQINEPKPGIMLYGFDEPPALDVKTNWSRSYNGSVPHNFYKEWIFYLNRQSQLDIFYDVKSPRFSKLSLVIAQGREELLGWIEKPSFPNTTFSWNIIYGRGRDKITQKISDPFSYYVALGNFYTQDVEGNFEDEWYHVKLTYTPRWTTYFVASGVVTGLIFFIFRSCNGFQRYDSETESLQQVHYHVVSERTPLLANKNDDALSLGSSYESFTSEEEDVTGKPLMKEGGEAENSMKHLCVICFDALRDCFFLPCGHSAACFQCATRVIEEANPCPICRRKIKKVRKIFTV
ncbi:hypothetical protein K1719_028080 [Acacia pycnantha]|nr:hypothetical protein K1719_028080 [Acacia pycnantha]